MQRGCFNSSFLFNPTDTGLLPLGGRDQEEHHVRRRDPRRPQGQEGVLCQGEINHSILPILLKKQQIIPNNNTYSKLKQLKMFDNSLQGWESGRLDCACVQADRHWRHEDRRLQQPRQVRHRVLRSVLRRQLIARQVGEWEINWIP